MIKSIQHITGVGSNTSFDITINPVDVSKTVVRRTYQSRQAAVNKSCAFYLLDSTTIRMQNNNTADTNWNYSLEVVEFL